MPFRFLLLTLSVCLCLIGSNAEAFPPSGLETDEIIVCPAAQTETPPKSFAGPDCRQTPHWRVDPQNQALWLTAPVYVSPEGMNWDGPVGLFVSIKASSRAWVNGVEIGSNGTPALLSEDEAPGLLDAVFFVPTETLQEGRNEVVLLLSGHHSVIRLSHPLHQAYLGPYHPARMRILDNYWPSLLSFGVFLIGALFFGTMAFLGQDRRGTGVLAITSFAGGGQLLAEITRGVWAYPYPVHDIRLLLILGSALLFGMSILALSAIRFPAGQRGLVVNAAVIVITLLAVIFAPGFDHKTISAIFFPCLGAMVLGTMAALSGRKEGWGHAGAFGIFVLLIIVAPNQFLDAYLYFALAALLTFLFISQARAMSRLRDEQREADRARQRLGEALEKAMKTEEPVLTIRSAGKLQRVAAKDVASARGAGDYVELSLRDGTEILHSGSLTALEKELPSRFLRVHRSHLVNTDLVEELVRQPSGTGELTLSTGGSVPVSKRIMPRVRKALDVV